MPDAVSSHSNPGYQDTCAVSQFQNDRQTRSGCAPSADTVEQDLFPAAHLIIRTMVNTARSIQQRHAMMATVYYKMRYRRSSQTLLRWPNHSHATFPTIPTMARGSTHFSDIPKPCRGNHCPSRPNCCSRRSCRNALASRLDRRELTITTKKNVLYPVLDNIDLIKKDIRHRCDRSAWKGMEISQAYARFASAMNQTVAPASCRCKTCAIERADRKIDLLKAQHQEAKRWLDALRKYRWKHDLDASSVSANVGR